MVLRLLCPAGAVGSTPAILHCAVNMLRCAVQAEKDCDALRGEINRITQQVHEHEAALTAHGATIQQLQNVIAEADQVGFHLHYYLCY